MTAFVGSAAKSASVEECPCGASVFPLWMFAPHLTGKGIRSDQKTISPVFVIMFTASKHMEF